MLNLKININEWFDKYTTKRGCLRYRAVFKKVDEWKLLKQQNINHLVQPSN